jgi:uncharacterized protein YllA (UPF0747 family)
MFLSQIRQEKLIAQQHVTRTSTGKLPVTKTTETVADTKEQTTSQQSNQKSVNTKQTPEEIKEKMEQQLKLQRAAHHQKRALEMKQQQGNDCLINKFIMIITTYLYVFIAAKLDVTSKTEGKLILLF